MFPSEQLERNWRDTNNRFEPFRSKRTSSRSRSPEQDHNKRIPKNDTSMSHPGHYSPLGSSNSRSSKYSQSTYQYKDHKHPEEPYKPGHYSPLEPPKVKQSNSQSPPRREIVKPPIDYAARRAEIKILQQIRRNEMQSREQLTSLHNLNICFIL